MPTTQIVRIFHSKSRSGFIWVSWNEKSRKKRRKRFDFTEKKKALGFACGLRGEKRDQSCILLPPDFFYFLGVEIGALFSLDSEWFEAIRMGQQVA